MVLLSRRDVCGSLASPRRRGVLRFGRRIRAPSPHHEQPAASSWTSPRRVPPNSPHREAAPRSIPWRSCSHPRAPWLTSRSRCTLAIDCTCCPMTERLPHLHLHLHLHRRRLILTPSLTIFAALSVFAGVLKHPCWSPRANTPRRFPPRKRYKSPPSAHPWPRLSPRPYRRAPLTKPSPSTSTSVAEKLSPLSILELPCARPESPWSWAPPQRAAFLAMTRERSTPSQQHRERWPRPSRPFTSSNLATLFAN